MIPGMNPKQMAQAMKAMGIKQKQINAEQVLIKTENETIKITNPQVIEIDMRGTKTYQIMGDITHEQTTNEDALKNTTEDIKLVTEQTGTTPEQAKQTLEKNNGDIAKTIMELTK